MRRERLAARGIFRACESGFGMQAPYVTRLIRNTGENFLNLSGSFLDVCGAGRSWRVLHNAPPSRLSGPALRRRGQMVLPGSGAGGREPAAATPPLGRGATLGSHQLCNTRLSLLYGREKERGVLGSPGGSGGSGDL